MVARIPNFVLENTHIVAKLGKRSAGDKSTCVIVDFSGLDLEDHTLAAEGFGAMTLEDFAGFVHDCLAVLDEAYDGMYQMMSDPDSWDLSDDAGSDED